MRLKYHLANSMNSALNEKLKNRYRNPRLFMKPMSRRALKSLTLHLQEKSLQAFG
jgi:hypothetical protein